MKIIVFFISILFSIYATAQHRKVVLKPSDLPVLPDKCPTVREGDTLAIYEKGLSHYDIAVLTKLPCSDGLMFVVQVKRESRYRDAISRIAVREIERFIAAGNKRYWFVANVSWEKPR